MQLTPPSNGPEISEERIRQFATDGGMPEENVTTFLDSRCYTMILILHGEVVKTLIQETDLMQKALVVEVAPAKAEKHVRLVIWSPAPYQESALSSVRAALQKHGEPKPTEALDLDQMDKALTGREYIRARLEAAWSAGHQI
jgi:hypothetical protein